MSTYLCRLLLTLVAMLWLTGCANFDEWQRMKVYRPTQVDRAEWQAELTKHPEIRAQTLQLGGDEQIQLLHFSATPGQSAKVKVLYLHGTLRHALQNSAKIEGITRNGMDVVAVDYRGWGASSYRIPDETSIHADAWASWLSLQRSEKDTKWVIYGHSMGSAVAVHLAARSFRSSPNMHGHFCALVLESAFTSFPDVARSLNGPLGMLAAAITTQKMASIDLIGEVPGPTWMLHGSLDKTIPVALGRKLFAAVREPKHWLDLAKDHSDMQTDTTGAYDTVWQQINSSCLSQK